MRAIDFAPGGRQHGVVRSVLVSLLTLVCLSACHVGPPPSHPRPALVHEAEPVGTPEVLELARHERGRSTGILLGDGERVRFEVRRADFDHDAEGVRPLVLLVPILAGGRELMGLIAGRLVDHGFDVAFCERAGRALTPPQRGAELDDLFRRTVLHQRLLLKWLRAADKPPPSIHVLGLDRKSVV